jgi:predicted metal-dependent phosphoesterase TrpH
VIDLHLHTTASDGRSSPDLLVREAAAAGLTTMAVTDHDTMAAVAAVRTAAVQLGIEVVPGIEISAVHEGMDVHILGYFLDAEHQGLQAFLVDQRLDRRRRLVEMAARLGELHVPVNIDTLMSSAERTPGRALGRPQLAAALVEAGHAVSIADAFDRFLGAGQPAFVARRGVGPVEVLAIVAEAGGLASLAHPGKLPDDDVLKVMVDAGLPAIEVFHPDHDEHAVAHYAQFARDRRLLPTGGSDYHGEASGRVNHLGRVGLPADDYRRLVRAVNARLGKSGP